MGAFGAPWGSGATGCVLHLTHFLPLVLTGASRVALVRGGLHSAQPRHAKELGRKGAQLVEPHGVQLNCQVSWCTLLNSILLGMASAGHGGSCLMLCLWQSHVIWHADGVMQPTCWG